MNKKWSEFFSAMPYRNAKEYYDVCLEGYKRFGFDVGVLEKALKVSSFFMAETML